ncbi:hypothetical protein [uncultured Pseudosulfitobacter sp.]|uniref:hypothetical protein n=1 Tax=uncultured Pseudosulfitobacter sp. TaxID=2854214 RepID=UPI0030DC97F8|tara:strand:- start:860 stop:1093 length:234 start_codon:yes stop_codon:yes gene_type:complete
MTLTDMAAAIAAIIKTCWLSQVTTKSDTARVEADIIAAAASEGLLTTRIGIDRYSRLWLPTPVGLEYLADVDEDVEF